MFFKIESSVWFTREGGKPSRPLLGVLRMRRRAPVLLIFNGKWLRFLSKPLELGDKNPCIRATSRLANVQNETNRCGDETLASRRFVLQKIFGKMHRLAL